MDKITLKRGRRKVTFKKLRDYLGVRLKQGRARDEAALETACRVTRKIVRHVDSVLADRMDIFAVEESEQLDETMKQLRDSPASEVVTHVYSLDDDSGGAVVPNGQLTVKFKAGVAQSKQEEILAAHGLEVVEDLDYLPGACTVRLTDASKENPLKIAAHLQAREEIEVAEPELSFQVSLKHVPLDNLYRHQWHLKNRGDRTGLAAGADVKAEAAWEVSRGSRNITVCVIDDGFDLGHPDLGVDGKLVSTRDFGQDDFDPNPVLTSDQHGTACAGVAIAEENGSGVVGLAPRCAFMPVRMSSWLTDQTVVDMFQFAIDKHADVISCSWSAGSWDFPLSLKMDGIIRKAATQGRRNGKGCVILFAAGNEDRPLDGEKDGKPSHQGFALHPDVIAVAASNSLDLRSSYSNFGPEITLCAPSNGSPGRGIVTTDRRGSAGYATGNYTFGFGGTSSATPLAAGLAGLILSVDPELTSAEVRQIMMDSADKIDPANGAYVNGHSPLYGHGRINAERALERASGGGAEEEERLPAVLLLEHRINKPIPDPGEMEDSIPFPLDVAISSVEVSVDIRHSWRGDLRLTLAAPNGSEIVLLDGSGGSQDDIVQSFRSSDQPSLFADVVGAGAAGDWRLKVRDKIAHDSGTLVKWGLAIGYR